LRVSFVTFLCEFPLPVSFVSGDQKTCYIFSIAQDQGKIAFL